MESAVWGLIGTIVGAAASLLATYLNNAHAAKISADARKEERREKLLAFQRDTLLALQMAIHDTVRTIFQVHLEDTKVLVSGSRWGEKPVAYPLAEEERNARGRILLYVERVADDVVRNDVKQLLAELNPIFQAQSKADADRALASFTSASVKVLELVGKTLRATY